MKTKYKIWVGAGAFVVAGTAASGVIGPPADAAPTGLRAGAGSLTLRSSHGGVLLAQHTEHGKPDAGEAGESGKSSGIANLPPELAFATRIALLRGHLLVGDELVKQQQWNAALPHFLHPTEEIYNDLKDALAEYKVAPFDGALKALADVVKARKGGADYARALKSVNDALAGADRAMQGRTGAWPALVTEAAMETLKVAGSEYNAAIVDGRISKPVEYQDARGFIWQAETHDRWCRRRTGEEERRSVRHGAGGSCRIEEGVSFGHAAPYAREGPADLLCDIARIELAAGRLM